MEVANSVIPCAEQHCADAAPTAERFEFESLEPVIEDVDVPVRIEFANSVMDRERSLGLEEGELIELDDTDESEGDSKNGILSPEEAAAQEVIILAGDRPIGTGIIVVIDDQLSVKVTHLNS